MIPLGVFDTNVLFSGLRWKGAPYQLVLLARQGQIRVVTCAQLLDELVGILVRKLGYTNQQAKDKIQQDLSFLEIVAVPGELHGVSTDPDDDIVIECAVEAGASYIVTGDKRHLLPLHEYHGILIESPATFLNRLTANETDLPLV